MFVNTGTLNIIIILILHIIFNIILTPALFFKGGLVSRNTTHSELEMTGGCHMGKCIRSQTSKLVCDARAVRRVPLPNAVVRGLLLAYHLLRMRSNYNMQSIDAASTNTNWYGLTLPHPNPNHELDPTST